MTRGRAGKNLHDLDLITLVVAVRSEWEVVALDREYREILRMCQRRPLSIAEIAAQLNLLLAAVEALVSDLITVALDFGRITINPRVVLYLFGTPGQDRFWFMWRELSVGALGAVVLADTRRLEDFFGAVDFFESREIPFIVAVNCFDGAEVYDEDEARAALDIGTCVPIQLCDVRDHDSSRRVLVRLMEHLVSTEMASIAAGQ